MSTKPLLRQSIASGSQAIQAYQKDGLIVTSAGIDEIILLRARDVSIFSGITYRVPKDSSSLLLLSLEVSYQVENGDYTLKKNEIVLASGSGINVPLINLPFTLLLPTDTINFSHSYSADIDFVIYAKSVYFVDSINMSEA